ncbi:ceramidase domain-containing protein [Rhodosalinus sp.]|uniref:ceramidase domain-containing protein n=1 Tax=Rhodosalinus sp. TaxID=2047741 RepID=UPI00397B19EE
MEWTRQIDSYCERLDASYWAEPVNAVTNAAFLIAAVVMWARVRGQGLPLAMALVWVLAAIGVGSYLFHTHAQVWSALLDVLPILLFILIYIYAANRHYWGLSRLWSGLGVAAFFPYAVATVPLFQMVPGLGSSAGYAPVPLLILVYAVLLRRRLPQVARGLAIGAGLLIASLTFRTLDLPLCGVVPVGTHFMWHILNGLMLGWMIEVYRRHMLASGQRGL